MCSHELARAYVMEKNQWTSRRRQNTLARLMPSRQRAPPALRPLLLQLRRHSLTCRQHRRPHRPHRLRWLRRLSLLRRGARQRQSSMPMCTMQ